jgi:hypothetical protein
LAYYAGKLCFWTALDRKKWLRVRFLSSLKMRWKNVLLYKQPIYDEMVATLAGNMTLSKYRKFSQEQVWKKNDEKYPYLWNDWIKKKQRKDQPTHFVHVHGLFQKLSCWRASSSIDDVEKLRTVSPWQGGIFNINANSHQYHKKVINNLSWFNTVYHSAHEYFQM